MHTRSRVPASLTQLLLTAAAACSFVGCGELLDADGYGLARPVEVEACADVLSVPLGDGACEPVGVQSCGSGFDADGLGGCVAVLPEAACGAAQLAFPGRQACAPVGTLPCPPNADPTTLPPQIGAGTAFVWGDYSGGASDGSAERPYRSIATALDAAVDGDVIIVSSGTYDGPLVVDKAIELRGLCPEQVVVRSSDPAAPSITLRAAVTLRGLRIEGAGTGVYVEGVDAELVELWLQDTGGPAIEARARFGQTKRPRLTVEQSLVEGSGGVGIITRGYQLDMSNSQVRAVREQVERMSFGVGIELRPSAYATARDKPGEALRSSAHLQNVLIEDVHDAAIRVVASEALIESTVVRDVAASAQSPSVGLPLGGVGLDVSQELGRSLMLPASQAVVLRHSVIERATGAGVRAFRGHVVIEDSVIRDTRAAAAPICMGQGVRVLGEADAEASLVLRRSLVEGSRQTGVHALEASVQLDHSIVRGSAADACGEQFGDGVGAYANPFRGGSAALMRVERSRIEGSRRAALVAFGGQVSVEQSLLVGGDAVAAIYSDSDALDAQRATIELAAGYCERAGSIASCGTSLAELEPALFFRTESGLRAPAVSGSGVVTTSPGSSRPLPGALVWALGSDELPSVMTDAEGRWRAEHIAASTQQIVVVQESEHITRFDAVVTPPPSTGVDSDGLSMIPLSVISPELANLIGQEIDFSRSLINLDTDWQGMVFDLSPSDGSTLFYVHDNYPLTEQQASSTSDEGDVLVAQQPAGVVTVTYSFEPKAMAPQCAPQPNGLPVVAGTSFRIPAVAGGVNFARMICEP